MRLGQLHIFNDDECLESQSRNLYQLQSERYQLFVEQADDGFYETNRSGSFTFFNAALCRIFDRSHEEIQHISFFDFMDSGSARSTAHSFFQMDKIDEVKWVACKIMLKDGTTRSITVSYIPMLNSCGQHIGFRGMVVRDATDTIIAREADSNSLCANQSETPTP